VAAALLLLLGCQSPMTDRAVVLSGDISADESRAKLALARVNEFAKGSAVIVVDPSDQPAAWSWSDGTICITGGFVRRIDDAELRAVIAHELAHLRVADGEHSTPHAFRGTSLAVEEDADAVAVRLLKSIGLAKDSLIRSLKFVRDWPQTTCDVKDMLNARIDFLSRIE